MASKLLGRGSGWGVFEQAAYKFCFKATIPENGKMSIMRHGRTGKRSERVSEEERTLWFAVEPYHVDSANFFLDEAGDPSQEESDTHIHPGTSVYHKSLDDAKRDWKPLSDFRQCSDLLKESGRAFPAKMIAMTIAEACQVEFSVADIEKILDEGTCGEVQGVEFAFFQSRALVLGRILDQEDGQVTLVMANRREVCMKDDLLVVELNKHHRVDDGTMAVHEPLLIRRIDAPAVKGQLWVRTPVSEETVQKLLDRAIELQGGIEAAALKEVKAVPSSPEVQPVLLGRLRMDQPGVKDDAPASHDVMCFGQCFSFLRSIKQDLTDSGRQNASRLHKP